MAQKCGGEGQAGIVDEAFGYNERHRDSEHGLKRVLVSQGELAHEGVCGIQGDINAHHLARTVADSTRQPARRVRILNGRDGHFPFLTVQVECYDSGDSVG